MTILATSSVTLRRPTATVATTTRGIARGCSFIAQARFELRRNEVERLGDDRIDDEYWACDGSARSGSTKVEAIGRERNGAARQRRLAGSWRIRRVRPGLRYSLCCRRVAPLVTTFCPRSRPCFTASHGLDSPSSRSTGTHSNLVWPSESPTCAKSGER